VRSAGIIVISIKMVASTPQPAKMPKCCTIEMPELASEKKVIAPMAPAVSMTGPTRTIDATTASRFASRGSRPSLVSRPNSS
jgi:hypothetical protein